MYYTVGSCPKCGAPIYAPANWTAITPPPSYHSCACFQQSQNTVTITNTDALYVTDSTFNSRR